MHGPSDVPTARAVLLSGEHPTLPLAELAGLLAVHDERATVSAQGLIAVVQPGRSDHTDAALRRMALAHEWGELWVQAPDDAEGLAHVAGVVRLKTRYGSGTAAVATERRGSGKGLDRATVERTIGAALKDSGHTIDLSSPSLTVFAWLLDGRIVCGVRRGEPDRSRYEARIADERAHFSPVSMHPRRVASLLHLARVPVGGRVYDPFCGTGGVLLEAALDGYDAWGSDLDSFMVQGTLQTLADTASDPLGATAFVADIGDTPDLVEGVEGIVTDLPYGRSSGTEGEALRPLYARAFAAFAKLLPLGGRAVIGHPDPALLDGIEAHGLEVVERHAEFVHRSLTRHYAVVIRS